MGRPIKNFHKFVGQKRAIALLQKLNTGAKALGKACPSILLTAPPGHGKSSMAKAIAVDYGSKCYLLSARQDIKAKDIYSVLAKLDFGDVFVIDEAHSLPDDCQEALYSVLDEWRIPNLSPGKDDCVQYSSVAECCLVLATNKPGLLTPALHDRLQHIELENYSIEELKAIAENIIEKEKLFITPQAARRVAQVSQGSPRTVSKHLEVLRLLNTDVIKFNETHVADLLSNLGIDQNGLTIKQQYYLITIANSPNGICTLERLSFALGYDPRAVKRDIEPYLINQGWINPEPHGRKITSQGKELAEHIAADQSSSMVANIMES